VYPNPALYNLENSFFAEIKKDQIFGKVLEIDLRSNSLKIYAEGFRGPSGITIQKFGKNQNIWLVDHGPRGGDELNLILSSRNYGWPHVSFGLPYTLDTSTSNLEKINTKFSYHEGYEKPIFYWSPSIAPSSMVTLDQNLDNNGSWSANDIVIGTLKDQSLVRLKISKNHAVQSTEKINLGSRVRDLTNVEKYLIASTDEGQLIILSPAVSKNLFGPFPPIYKEKLYFYSRLPGAESISRYFDNILRLLANKI
jgi:glucose/arabinose dehydrogenase